MHHIASAITGVDVDPAYQPTPPRSPRLNSDVDIKQMQPTDETARTKDAAELDAIMERSCRQKVVQKMSPEELATLVDFSLPTTGRGLDGVWKLVEATLKYSVNSWNPRFMDKLYASTSPIGVLSELLLGLMNVNVHVYHVSPVVTTMETTLCQQMGRLVGFGEHAGGLACPGGAASNLLSAVTARNA
ncbi:pyridoxal phosphate-dependent transferase, partial [Thamnocephalis sphaerospora]